MLSMLIVSFFYALIGQLGAQTFTVLHSLSDGGGSSGGLISDGSRLYGTAQFGGNSAQYGVNPGQGALFAINSDGSGFTNLYSFARNNTNSAGIYTNTTEPILGAV